MLKYSMPGYDLLHSHFSAFYNLWRIESTPGIDQDQEKQVLILSWASICAKTGLTSFQISMTRQSRPFGFQNQKKKRPRNRYLKVSTTSSNAREQWIKDRTNYLKIWSGPPRWTFIATTMAIFLIHFFLTIPWPVVVKSALKGFWSQN